MIITFYPVKKGVRVRSPKGSYSVSIHGREDIMEHIKVRFAGKKDVTACRIHKAFSIRVKDTVVVTNAINMLAAQRQELIVVFHC